MILSAPGCNRPDICLVGKASGSYTYFAFVHFPFVSDSNFCLAKLEGCSMITEGWYCQTKRCCYQGALRSKENWKSCYPLQPTKESRHSQLLEEESSYEVRGANLI